jgi:nucleotide-binding universal stress UspA family protein
MRAVIWITEGSWERCVDRARELVPADAEVTLLHVSPADVEELAAGPGPRLLGRHHPPPPGPSVHEISEDEARSLLAAACGRLGRPAELVARRGRVEREVIAACEGSDLLVLARDGKPRREPKSLGRWSRFVVDHAGCAVLLVWPEDPPEMEWPPHLR